MAFWKKNTDPSEESAYQSTPVKNDGPGAETKINPLEEDLLRRFGRIRSALSPGTIIQGKLSFDSPVRIDGKLTGDIFCSQTLLIGPEGFVSADVEAEVVVVLGQLKGSIKAASRIEILPGSIVEADLIAPTIVVHEGAFVKGQCKMVNPGNTPKKTK